MRESVHELNRIPQEFQENSAPEFPELPDEFNRFPRKAKARKDLSRLRRIMLLLAVAGLLPLGILAPLHPKNRPAEAEAAPTAETESPAETPEASALPTPIATPAPTEAPTPEPTPEPAPEPTPGVEPIFFRTSQVYFAVLKLSVPEKITDASFRLRDPVTNAVAVETHLTSEEIADGIYESDRFDANGFLVEQFQTYPDPDTIGEPELVMDTTFTFRTDAGEETVEIGSAAEAAPWIGVNYDTEEDIGGIVEFMYGTVYPNCFVVRIEEARTADLRVIFGDEPEALEAGDVLITITADGNLLTGEFAPTDLFRYFDGESFIFNFVYAVPAPDTFPEHGTAQIVIRQKLTRSDYIYEKKTEITY